MTTATQDKKFIADMISSRLLEEAIEWVKDNLEPDEVFEEDVLRSWAESNGYVDNT